MSPSIVLRAAAAPVVTAAVVAVVSAASPTFWQVSTQADFLKGEVVENIAIDSDGRLVLGPAHELVYEATAPFLWSAFVDARGELIAGTGNEGKVLRVGADGRSTVLFDASELEAHAIAPGPDGSVYVATSPDGRIYRVAGDGAATTMFDPEDKYLWSLAVAPDGSVFAGSGDKGIVYRVAPDGRASTFLRTNTTNVTALAFDRSGDLLVGTESPGYVMRVGRDGRAFVLLDSPYREIRSLRTDERGNIYVAAVSGRPAEPRPPERPAPDAAPAAPVTPTVSTEITITAIGDVQVPSTTTAPPRPDSRKENKGAVYRIAPDGLWDVVWESSDDSPYDVAFDGPDALLIATGGKGKIFRISGEPTRTTLVARAAAQQITAFVRGRNGELYSLTSNPGKVYRLASVPATRGVYESDVRDASTVATWGTLRWRASVPPGCGLEVSTRSGNTSKPDQTWSDWSAPYRNDAGEPIASPKARYLQWRAVLSGSKGATPVLTSVTAAYLPRNVRPVVESITVHPAGTVFQRPFSTGEAELAGFETSTSDGRPLSPAGSSGIIGPTPVLGRRTYQKGLQTFVWKSSDENDDRLQYDVHYRREGDASWRVLKRGLWDPILTWDTTSVPDGTYTIRVVASDAPSNAPATALSGELESVAFDIDNTPPAIAFGEVTVSGGRPRVTFTVRDDHSPVNRVEYSLDASRWRVVYPVDGLADSRVESFAVVIDDGMDGNNIIVRATDVLNNVATALVRDR
jgi:sugar lactone lactonase YvrE